MPYIAKITRKFISGMMDQLECPALVGANRGVVNYIITRILWCWMGKKVTYERINDAIGVLECVKLELYRRVAAPYEDRKKEENGDVY